MIKDTEVEGAGWGQNVPGRKKIQALQKHRSEHIFSRFKDGKSRKLEAAEAEKDIKTKVKLERQTWRGPW